MQLRSAALILCVLVINSATARDSLRAVASHRYARPSLIERILLGANYRDIWSMPVTAPIFRLEQDKGGLRVERQGGGMQTLSLHLEDVQNHDWLLRSVDKSVDRAMEAFGIRNKPVRLMSQKMISAAHPYGALTIPPLAKALGVTSTDPVLVYVPDDPAFGQYRQLLANSLCLLEHREPSRVPGSKVVGTEKMLAKLRDDSAYTLDRKALLHARLLDMLIGDWDRHGEQWKWEYHPSGENRFTIYPVPRDHDQAYFNSTGMIFELMRLVNAHMFVGFRRQLKLKALNYKSWSFDKQLLDGLSEEDWRSGIRSFQAALNDSVLSAGVRLLPQEVYVACSEKMLRLLKSRRDRMNRDGIRYYRFLQSHPRKIRKQERKALERARRAHQISETEESGH